MHRTYLLVVTAFLEAGIGALLLALPSIPLWLLLGVEQAAPEVALVSRVAGAALLALGVACWLGRGPRHCPAQPGLFAGALVYDGTVAVLLAHAGLALGMAGIALWPAVVLHACLALWCALCLLPWPGGDRA
jgi:hypothetical protein